MAEEIKQRKKSGNPNLVKGMPNPYRTREAIVKRNTAEAAKRDFEKYTKKEILKKKRELLASILKAAEGGNVPALKEVFDRIMGKAVSPLEVSGKDGQPIEVMSFRDLEPKEEPQK